MSTIKCLDLGDFLAVIAGLVEHGLVFKADAGTLVITLTGGH